MKFEITTDATNYCLRNNVLYCNTTNRIIIHISGNEVFITNQKKKIKLYQGC